MENISTLFAKTEEVTGAVAQAMAAVASFLESADADVERVGECRFECGVLKGKEIELKRLLADSLAAIRYEWNRIVQNDMLLDEVCAYVENIQKFHAAAGAFDDSVCLHGIDADEILGDSWLARRYLSIAADWEKSAGAVIDFAGSRRRRISRSDDPFSGMARRLHKFFVGVHDDELKALVLDGVSLAARPKWLQDRRQAVVFGKTLGISCRDMNRSFMFVTRDGTPRALNYSSDGPTLDYSCYEIYPLISGIGKV